MISLETNIRYATTTESTSTSVTVSTKSHASTSSPTTKLQGQATTDKAALVSSAHSHNGS